MAGLLTEAQLIHRRNPKYEKLYDEDCMERCGVRLKKPELELQQMQANSEARFCPICGKEWGSGVSLEDLF